jgi:hypothetical protein
MPSSSNRSLLWWIFTLASVTAIAFFFIPAFVIQPFKHQSPVGLIMAMTLRQRAPWATLIAGILSLVIAISLWRPGHGFEKLRRSLGRRTILVVVMVVVTFSAVMSRLNYFEWMFHPIPGTQFQSAAESKLDQGEMVLAVDSRREAHAYPISEMAYHHIFNDVIEGVPIVATY